MFSRLPEEIETRHRHTEERYGPDPPRLGEAEQLHRERQN